MFEKGMPGGQITNSSEIENYPGVTGEITGMDLMMPWPEQCQKFGLKHEMVSVTRITKSSDIFTIHKEDGSTSDAYSVIVGTGSSPRRVGLLAKMNFLVRELVLVLPVMDFSTKEKKLLLLVEAILLLKKRFI